VLPVTTGRRQDGVSSRGDGWAFAVGLRGVMISRECWPLVARLRVLLLAVGVLVVLTLGHVGPAVAQDAPQTRRTALPRIHVTTSKRKPVRRGTVAGQRGSNPLPAPATPALGGGPPKTPLNTNTIAESGSRLGLTARQIPATVEIIDKQTIEDRGLKTTTDVAQAAVGVTAGDAPGAPAAFSMRGFSYSEINILYNGIKIGPQGFTSRVMDAGNLEQIEFYKGPNSVFSGEGATGGTVNFVTKKPPTGPIQNEAFTSWDSFNGYRQSFGSGGSTQAKGLDYRFDVSRANNNSFIDDTYTKLFNISGQLNYQVTSDFKIWGAVEYKQDRNRLYWGTPLVSTAFSGSNATPGVVSGSTGSLGPVTIDNRTLKTSYNVLDNYGRANELWLRGGFDWQIASNLRLKSQFYGYDASRKWLDSEFYTFDPATNLVNRDRFFVGHDQKLVGNISDLIFDSTIAGMDNRLTTTLAASRLEFRPTQDTVFGGDSVSLVNPDRGTYGPLVTRNLYTQLDNISLSFEDRLKLTPTFALIGGIRVESIELLRDSFETDGTRRAGFPLSKAFTPVTGRIGYTWEALPGLIFYSQYATAADAAVATIFNLSPTRPLELTTTRTYETGVKQLFWNNRAEWTFSAFDIERRNVYSPVGPPGAGIVEVAGKIRSKGIELAGAVRPDNHWKLWGNIAWVRARLEDFTTDTFSGNTPPNVPHVVANAGASYRFNTAWPVEIGGSMRHISDRFLTYDNAVTMDGYTIADAYVFVDIPKWVLTSVDRTRLAFRVRNITDKTYAVWSDPGYTDQILLGAPRSYEVSAAFKF
jgi:iron complex outermembrane receptor protein